VVDDADKMDRSEEKKKSNGRSLTSPVEEIDIETQ